MKHISLAFAAGLLAASTATAAYAKTDQSFMKDAIQGNLAEIQVGQLAQQRGGSDQVKSFGQMLQQDHSAANDKAMALAQSLKITPPTEPKPEAKKTYDKLSGLSGDAFDRAFVNAMIKDHKKDIAEYKAEAKGSDQVAQLAKDTLPTLQKHLDTAQSIESGHSASR